MRATQIGCIGPGLMGSGIARRLLQQGHPVTLFAHRPGLDLGAFTALGAATTDSPAELARLCPTLLLTVPSSVEVEDVIGRLLEHLRRGATVIDLSTSLPSSTRSLATRLAERGVDLLDAPMTRGPLQAAAGTLNIMVGGSQEAYRRCEPLLRDLSENLFYVGPSGSGHTVKLINNFLGQLTNAAIAEVLPLAVKTGIDLQALYDVVRVSGGNSRSFEGRVPLILDRDFTVAFRLALVHKDLGYLSRLGREANVPLPLVNSALQVVDLALARGLGEGSDTGLVRLWEEISGVEVRRGSGKPVP